MLWRHKVHLRPSQSLVSGLIFRRSIGEETPAFVGVFADFLAHPRRVVTITSAPPRLSMSRAYWCPFRTTKNELLGIIAFIAFFIFKRDHCHDHPDLPHQSRSQSGPPGGHDRAAFKAGPA